MIVESIQVENWGILREPSEIEFSDGLNIVHGPNDAGKSTIVDSVRTVFFTKHSSRSERIRSLVPWGSELPPKATIIFQKNGVRYRITKRFKSSESSLLERHAGNKWERIAEGDNADSQVVELVGGRFPARGDTKPELWGMGQALWMVQGEPFISDNLNEETLSSLQRIIGASIESDTEKKIFEIVNDEYSKIFTKRRRGFRKGSEVADIIEKVAELEERKSHTEASRHDKDGLIRRMDDNEVVLERKGEKLKAALEGREELKQKVDIAHEHRRDRERIGEEVKRIDSELDVLRDHAESIKEGREKIATVEAENKRMREKRKESEMLLEDPKGKLEESKKQIDEIKENLDLNETDLQLTRIAYDVIQKERELTHKEDLLKDVSDLDKELSKRAKALGLIIAPSKDALSDLRTCHQKIHDIKTKLDTYGLATRINAKSDLSGSIFLDGSRSDFELGKGKREKWTSHQTVRIRIKEVGDFEIRSGSEDIKELRDTLEKAEVDFEEGVAPFSVKDVKELEELTRRKEELEKEVVKLKKDLEKRAKKGKDEIAREVAGLRKRAEANWAKIPVDSELREFSKYEEGSLAQKELSARMKKIEARIANWKKEQKVSESTYTDLEKKSEALQVETQELNKRIHGNESRMEEIRTGIEKIESDGLSLEEREEKLNKTSAKLDKKERAWKQYEKEKEEIEGKPLTLWDESETGIERLREDISSIERENAGMGGELNRVLDDLKDMIIIDEELEYLKDRKKRILSNSHAIELLRDLMKHYRTKTIESLTTPIQKLMAEDVRDLLGEKYKDVEFSAGVKPISVEVPQYGVKASIDVLSFGTKEQMWFLFRLALGRLLSGEDKQLVVLDDPLANTDPSKLRRALNILKGSAAKLQIVVLTCDVDKYNWLSDANFIPFAK